MAQKNKRQFGVWMDSHHAIVVGKQEDESSFNVIGSVKNAGAQSNSSEYAANNQEITLTTKFFKEIAHHMLNADEVLVTGTGQVQEQFIKFLAETPQYKNAKTSETTSNKVSEEQLVKMIAEHFN